LIAKTAAQSGGGFMISNYPLPERQWTVLCLHFLSICLRLDIFALQNRYMAAPFDMLPKRREQAPALHAPQGISRASAHIERKAHIANPTRDLYRC